MILPLANIVHVLGNQCHPTHCQCEHELWQSLTGWRVVEVHQAQYQALHICAEVRPRSDV
ncbi:Uncharacterised protein [Burkholderia pseudomallei]|nr:Uncharacterised protein [Burkholderia pseudomallei]